MTAAKKLLVAILGFNSVAGSNSVTPGELLAAPKGGVIKPGEVARQVDELGGSLSRSQRQFLDDLAERYPAGSTARMMAEGVRKLQPGDTVIGFMTRDGKLIGQFADPSLGHDALSVMTPGLRSQIQSGQAIAITVGKSKDGVIRVFGSGTFPPPGGTLSDLFKRLAEKLVE